MKPNTLMFSFAALSVAPVSGCIAEKAETKLDAKVIMSRMAAESKDVTRFFDGLPETDVPINAPQGWDQEDNWHWATSDESQATSYFIENQVFPPDVTTILAQALLSRGDTIREYRDRRANGRIGIATCNAGKAVVIYGFDAKTIVSPYGLAFFRAHELGHHALGHVKCGDKGDQTFPLQPKDEIDADCFAKHALLPLHDGLRVFDRAWAQLLALHRPPQGHYPSTDERADALDNRCAEGPQSAGTHPQ